ncbi:MAG: HAMP domain-containing sensor histidine kinase [Bacteroidales bacterium]|jgi:signal transduction histidine kinase
MIKSIDISSFKLNPEDRDILRNEFFITNIHRWRLYLLIAIPVSLAHIILFTLNLDPGKPVEFEWRKGILQMHAVLILLAVIYGTYAHLILKKHQTANRFDRIAGPLFVFLLITCGAIIAAIDQKVTTAITPFLILCIVPSLLLLVRPLLVFCICVVSYVFFIFIMKSAQPDPDILLSIETNGLTAIGLAIGLSTLLWKAELTHRRQNRLISRQKIELESSYQKLRETAGELEKVNATKDRFFSIIAHDLLSPMSGISSVLEILHEEHGSRPNGPREMINTIGRLRESVDSTLRLLRNLLDWAHTQRNDIVFEPKPVDLITILNHAALSLSSQAEKKQITVSMPEIQTAVTVLGDSNMLETIFRNLISNAIKFSQVGSVITINLDQQTDKISVSVSDTGVGITMANLDKLFRIGEKITSRGTQQESGTGLGLILCQEFVNQHGGRILVESEVGRGSKFTVELPLGRNR